MTKFNFKRAIPTLTVILAVASSGIRPAHAEGSHEGAFNSRRNKFAQPCVVANYQNAANPCVPSKKAKRAVDANPNLVLNFDQPEVVDVGADSEMPAVPSFNSDQAGNRKKKTRAIEVASNNDSMGNGAMGDNGDELSPVPAIPTLQSDVSNKKHKKHSKGAIIPDAGVDTTIDGIGDGIGDGLGDGGSGSELPEVPVLKPDNSNGKKKKRSVVVTEIDQPAVDPIIPELQPDQSGNKKKKKTAIAPVVPRASEVETIIPDDVVVPPSNKDVVVLPSNKKIAKPKKDAKIAAAETNLPLQVSNKDDKGDLKGTLDQYVPPVVKVDALQTSEKPVKKADDATPRAIPDIPLVGEQKPAKVAKPVANATLEADAMDIPAAPQPEEVPKKGDLLKPELLSSSNQNFVAGAALNSTFNLRSKPTIESKSYGKVGNLMGDGMSVETSAANPEWLKVSTGQGIGYVNRKALKPVRLKGDFTVRSAPSLTDGEKLGMVRDVKSSDELVVTGRSKTVKANGKSNTFLEVIYKGQPAWVHDTALVDGLPPEVKITATASDEKVSTPETVGKKRLVARGQGSPRCVSTASEMKKNHRLAEALKGTNPFTTWSGPMWTEIKVSQNGTAMLTYPRALKAAGYKDRQFKTSVCIDGNNKPYLSLGGSVIYFQGETLNTAAITDPGSGKTYKFRRSQ